jgi:hypothetical protein
LHNVLSISCTCEHAIRDAKQTRADTDKRRKGGIV